MPHAASDTMGSKLTSGGAANTSPWRARHAGASGPYQTLSAQRTFCGCIPHCRHSPQRRSWLTRHSRSADLPLLAAGETGGSAHVGSAQRTACESTARDHP